MKKLKHSLADWDFQPGQGLGIGTDQYVSSPSSLQEQLVDVPGKEIAWVFLKSSIRQKIQEGRFITYHRTTHAIWQDWFVYFWTQAKPINRFPANTYFIRFLTADITLGYMLNDAWNSIKVMPRDYEWNINTWYRYRVTWFTFLDASLETALKVIVDIEQAGEWVEKMNYNITDPLWLASDTKLVGFDFRGSDTSPSWIDDTEIWERA